MVKPRTTNTGIAGEFAGGILPGLTGTPQPQGGAVHPQPLSQRDGMTVNQHDGNRKKVTVYLDDPDHTNLMDDLLTELKRKGLPRDNSMLIRALLNQAGEALTDKDKMAALVRACEQTLPKTASR